jgi:hypothetical protein
MTDRFLSTLLRKALERDIKAARKVAEDGVADAIRRLGVAESEAPTHLSEHDKTIRRRLRAHARALGDTVVGGVHTVDHLIEAGAYAQWHRRLFARFLAERNLLRHPEHGVPITLEEAEELASEEGYADAWSAAEAYAARMLPAVFQPDDPALALSLAPEHAQALRRLVLGLDPDTFQSDDALGWTYQFWRVLEKERVNKGGEKIGARELPAVTQLFTEPYMVKFLLHNTLGAWRAGKILAARPEIATDAADENALRAAVSPPGYSFDLLRFVRGGEAPHCWRPAAGTFPGWPETAAAIRVLDPCCGSGHFLTEVLAILSSLRADEEGLADAQAVTAVLRDNLFGLELDGRCVQIAAFAVALAAWRIGGFQAFGSEHVHIAWVGAPPPLDRTDFEALGNGDGELRYALGHLHDLFRQAPLLGSLLEPTGGDLLGPKVMGKLAASLPALVDRTRSAEPERSEGAVAARGMADALSILGEHYTLVATNVPFLGRGKQTDALKTYIDHHEPAAKGDLATAMLGRIRRLLEPGGTMAAVSPQEWCFLVSYREFRSSMLGSTQLSIFATLGEEAWEAFGDRGPLATLSAWTRSKPPAGVRHSTIDVTNIPNREAKKFALAYGPVTEISQSAQIANPDYRILSTRSDNLKLLNIVASAFQGISTGDVDRFKRMFWEVGFPMKGWRYLASTVSENTLYGGLEHIVRWEADGSHLAAVRGASAWGKRGVAVSQMRHLPVTLYTGHLFDGNVSAVIPNDPSDIEALYAYCSDPSYKGELKKIDKKKNITNATLVKVPCDISHWAKVAKDRYPEGLPEPYSDDPTQWIFHGHPAEAEAGTQLHVALARLAGFRWPAELDPSMPLSSKAREQTSQAATLPAADADGVLPLLAVAGDRPLSDRLRDYLNVAIPDWDEATLVRDADQRIDKKSAKDVSLDAWLRDRAFRQHSTLFHGRPFLWQIWDGQKDGFSAFLDYHRLDHALLQKLTYTLLGAWITRRQAENDSRRVEAALILKAKLEAILEGEEPHDIFVRWKALEQQPLGWMPSLDDGVRLNIRPWITAGVLREAEPRGIKWGVDGGKDAPSAPWFPLDKGDRNNNRHTALRDKRAARDSARPKAEL